MANINIVETVKQLLFKTLSCYPDSVLLEVYMSSSDLVKRVVLNYAFVKTNIQNKEMVCKKFKYIDNPHAQTPTNML